MTSGDWWFNPPALLVESQFFITILSPYFEEIPMSTPHDFLSNSSFGTFPLSHPHVWHWLSRSHFFGEIREGMSQHFGTQKTSQDSLSVKNWGFKLFPSFSHSYPKMSPKLEFL
jgi:hypothetical protein